MSMAIKGEVEENRDKVKTTANQFLQNNMERFALLAEIRLS